MVLTLARVWMGRYWQLGLYFQSCVRLRVSTVVANSIAESDMLIATAFI